MARILLIDDDPSIRTVLRCWLEKKGHDIDEAENGEEGLSQFRSVGADLVITDLFMPEREGLETTLHLRRMENAPEVIVISGHPSYAKIFLQTAKRLGARTVLSKPFSPEEIIEAVNDALAKRK
ncbi:MAG TPA: response regulator [Verrucomicrobiae bacterium]|jgi:CheY-like chemotaxis protein|nr:response regulator [Verrucomicrobiae bacterium]